MSLAPKSPKKAGPARVGAASGPRGAPRSGAKPPVIGRSPAPPPAREDPGTPGTGVRQVLVPEDRAGQRLDNYLLGQLKGVPRTHVYRLLRTGQVRVNGKRAKPDQRLEPGDRLRIPPVRMAEPDAPVVASTRSLADLAARIVFEDRNFIVLDKPHGLASHGGSGIKLGAIEQLRQLRPDESLELVHRLDRDTSGVLFFARRRSALTAIQSLIREGRVRKRYLALLAGPLPQRRVRVDVALQKSVLSGGERMVRVDPAGKESLSEFALLEKRGECSYVEVVIATGRTHQIRVHAAHLGAPVAGDEKYGDAEANKRLRLAGLKRMFLHAAEFAFDLPDGTRYHVTAPLPPELSAVLDRLPPGK